MHLGRRRGRRHRPGVAERDLRAVRPLRRLPVAARRRRRPRASRSSPRSRAPTAARARPGARRRGRGLRAAAARSGAHRHAEIARPPLPRRAGRGPDQDLLNRRVTALYRKYRPQTFEEVVGQEAVVRTLMNAIEQGKVRQAYLFAGPRGTGKTRSPASSPRLSTARTARPRRPTTLPRLRRISNGTSLDVIEMDAASQRGIDDIREIRDRVVLQPVEGRTRSTSSTRPTS